MRYEYEMIVQGWKMEAGRRREFSSRMLFSKSGLAHERSRIGAAVENWQPHITKVEVWRREVGEWERFEGEEVEPYPEPTPEQPVTEPVERPVFPWNDLIGMTDDGGERAMILALNALFDAVMFGKDAA